MESVPLLWVRRADDQGARLAPMAAIAGTRPSALVTTFPGPTRTAGRDLRHEQRPRGRGARVSARAGSQHLPGHRHGQGLRTLQPAMERTTREAGATAAAPGVRRRHNRHGDLRPTNTCCLGHQVFRRLRPSDEGSPGRPVPRIGAATPSQTRRGSPRSMGPVDRVVSRGRSRSHVLSVREAALSQRDDDLTHPAPYNTAVCWLSANGVVIIGFWRPDYAPSELVELFIAPELRTGLTRLWPASETVSQWPDRKLPSDAWDQLHQRTSAVLDAIGLPEEGLTTAQRQTVIQAFFDGASPQDLRRLHSPPPGQ